MRLLIGCSPDKFFHLKEFAENLKKKGVECKLVIDTSVYTGFPSREVAKWFETKGKFNDLIKTKSFYERARVFNNLYGTLKDPVIKNLSQGKDVLFDIDWQGSEQIKRLKLKNKLNCPTNLLGVTLLTSFSDEDIKELGHSLTVKQSIENLAALANSTGLDGIVCSPLEVKLINEKFPKFQNKEIEDIIMNFQRVLNRFDDQKFTKISSRMIVLKK